jgi:cytochrome b subunit of formate dehydrogenase
MEIFRRGRNPWGEEVIIGLGWQLFWVVVVLGALFVVGHAIFAARKAKAPYVEPPSGGAIPEKLVRHSLSARLSHWILAASVIVLLVTAFVPILGLKFPWVTIHWIAGLVFTAYVIYHLVDTIQRKTLGTMWVTGSELREGMAQARAFTAGEGAKERPGKWGVENKLFHHVTGLAGLAVLVTGLLMMFRIDTAFWAANPYILSISSGTWGWVYWLHGFSAVGFVGLALAGREAAISLTSST